MKPSLFFAAIFLGSLIGCGDNPAPNNVATDSGEFAEVITTRPDDGPDTAVADSGTAMDSTMSETTAETGAETSVDSGSDTKADTGGSVTTITASGTSFSPSTVTIKVGQKVRWVVTSGSHTVTSGTSCVADNKFCNPSDASCATPTLMSAGAMYEHTFTTAGDFPYFCVPHCSFGMTGKVTVTP